MSTAGNEVVPGDWVRQFSAGIWRVSRILRGLNEFRNSLNKPKIKSKRSLVFSNRLVNNSWKRSFSTGSCELAWIKLIGKGEQERIGHLLREDAALRKAFEDYEPVRKPTDLIVNLGFGLGRDCDRSRFEAIRGEALAEQIQQGLTLDEVLELVRAVGYEAFMGRYPINATLQLVCQDHEIRGPEFVMRRDKVNDF